MTRMLMLLPALIAISACVSIDAERPAIDEAMWSAVAVEYGAPIEDESALTYLRDVGDRLAPFAPDSEAGPEHWTYTLLDDEVAQAFTTIDGRIVLTTGLALELRREDELAAILARQMAHARLQHAWSFMNSQISAAGFFIWPKGALSGGAEEAKVEYASWLFHREGVGFMHPFQAWQLLDADEAAATMLADASYDPGAIERLLDISEAETAEQYGYTYGHVATRREAAARRSGREEADKAAGDEARFTRFLDAIGG